jgi:DNA (cytosine-5)-methyltransferase 1
LPKTRSDSYAGLSFFTGAMGLDLGLEAAGVDMRLGQELDPSAVATIVANGRRVIPGDLRLLLTEDPGLVSLMAKANLCRGETFVVVGGPPCQPFSTAGNRQGVNDSRGMLVFDFLKAVNAIAPRFMILENVKGLLSATGTKGAPLLDEILTTLNTMGYKAIWQVLDASHFGAAQFRERLVIIASRDGEDIFIPAPTHFPKHQSPDHRWRTLRDVIGDLESDPGEYIRFSPKVQSILELIPEGGNWRSLPPKIAKDAMGGAWNSGGGKVGFFRRLNYSEPSPTLVTSPIQKATLLCHPTQNRPLSVKEYSRIQGFPDDWVVVGNLANRYKQLGNAVPLALGKALGQMLLAVATNSSTIYTKRRRGTATHNSIDTVASNEARMSVA